MGSRRSTRYTMVVASPRLAHDTCARRVVTVSGPYTRGWNIQSCTSNDTFGFSTRLLVFLDDGFVVITMTGACGEKRDDGRYV